jgi:hypothetical protein
MIDPTGSFSIRRGYFPSLSIAETIGLLFSKIAG